MTIYNQNKQVWKKKRKFPNNNMQFLFEHGGLHPMISIKRKYTLGNVYNQTKEIFIKNWKAKSLLGLDLSEDTTNSTNHEISEINIKCSIL